jgi:hypothetical protein
MLKRSDIMVITILEGRVTAEKQDLLRNAYSSAISKLEDGIVETFLISDSHDNESWKIMTIWKDKETLMAMRNSGETPRGILIFREAGVEPQLNILRVDAHASA